MNKKLIVPFALTPLAAPALRTQSQQSDGRMDMRPNIILFVVGDIGWQGTSLSFWAQKTHYNEVCGTPDIRHLAKQGVMFAQAYASSISSLTRYSLITGTNAARYWVTNWTYPEGQQTGRPGDVFNVADWNVNGVCQVPNIDHTFQATSLAEILKNNDYHTVHCGKAYFGAMDTPGESPYHMGFEVNITGHVGDGLASYLGENSYGNRMDRKSNPWLAAPGLDKYWRIDTFISGALTLEAVEALNHTKEYNRPFFLCMAHYTIHVPVDKDKRFYQKYIDKGLTPRETTYAALIEGMDKSLDNLMDWLNKNGEADNIIIIFMSDNRGLSSEPGWRDGKLRTRNSPLNSDRGSAYEGGMREPMIVRWPGVAKPGTKYDEYLTIEDFYPSILEVAQVKHYKTVQPIDGTSFIPLLKRIGDPSKGRSLYWNFPNRRGNDGLGMDPTCTVRKGDWKLIYYYENGKKELFNIPRDIGEEGNLTAQHPDIVKYLSKDLGNYLRKAGGQRPSFKVTGEPCP